MSERPGPPNRPFTHPCERIGAHVALPDGTTCGTREWLSCDECGRFEMADPHAPCPCGIPANLPTESDLS